MSAASPHMRDTPLDVTVVYDGECPVCNFYVRMYRLRALASHVHLIDARDTDDPIMDDIRHLNLNIDQGMVVKLSGRLYHGADAMNILAILGSGNTAFNWLNHLLFRNPRAARLLYPLLVRGRLCLLRLLGRPLIAEA